MQPDIPIERLEFDRIHRAPTAKKLDGPPRDIIVKCHYYCTKEQLLSSARDKKDLNFQGNNYQLFADLSQVTISKKRAMKPFLMKLQCQSIIYQWGFPFSVRFAHNGTKYICRSNEELQQTLIDLHLMESSPRITSTPRRSPSLSSAGNSSQSTLRNGNHPSHKRGRFASPFRKEMILWTERSNLSRAYCSFFILIIAFITGAPCTLALKLVIY